MKENQNVVTMIVKQLLLCNSKNIYAVENDTKDYVAYDVLVDNLWRNWLFVVKFQVSGLRCYFNLVLLLVNSFLNNKIVFGGE